MYRYILLRGCSMLLLALPERFGQVTDALHQIDEWDKIVLRAHPTCPSKRSQKTRAADPCLHLQPSTLPKSSCLLCFLQATVFRAADLLLFHLFQIFLILSDIRDRRTHKHLCAVLHTCHPCSWGSSFQSSKVVGQRAPHGTALFWFVNPYGRGSAPSLLWENLECRSEAGCCFPYLYISADTFVPERTLGMALIEPQGLGRNPPPVLL